MKANLWSKAIQTTACKLKKIKRGNACWSSIIHLWKCSSQMWACPTGFFTQLTEVSKHAHLCLEWIQYEINSLVKVCAGFTKNKLIKNREVLDIQASQTNFAVIVDECLTTRDLVFRSPQKIAEKHEICIFPQPTQSTAASCGEQHNFCSILFLLWFLLLSQSAVHPFPMLIDLEAKTMVKIKENRISAACHGVLPTFHILWKNRFLYF